MSYYWTNFGIYKPPNDVTVTGLDPASTSHTILQDIGVNSHPTIDGHLANSTNPHGATLTQTTLNSTNIVNTQLVDTFDLTSPTGKITALQCAQINNLSPATGLLVATPLLQNDSSLATNNTPNNVITTSTVGSANTYTKTPFSSFVTPTSSNVLSNKTIDTAAPNTIQVGSTNITSIISASNPVLSTSSPTFTRLNINSSGSIGINITTPSGGQPGISFDSVANTYMNFNAASATRFQVGAFSSIAKSILWSTGGYPLSLGVGGNEVLQIPSTGIANNNADTNLLCINNGVLEYRTVASLPGTNPFNQSLNTGDSPIFQSVNANNGIAPAFNLNPNGSTVGQFVSASGGSSVILWTTTNSADLVFGTNQVRRLTIPAAGIANNNADTNLLCINNGVLEYRTVASLPVNNPFNQSLNTTNGATFDSLTLTSTFQTAISMTNGYITKNNTTINVIEASTYPGGLEVRDFSFAGSVPTGGGNADLFVYNILFGYVGSVDLIFTAGTTSGGYGSYHYNFPVINTAGVTTISGALYSDKKENVAPFPGKLGITTATNGASQFILRFTNSGAVPIKIAGRARIDMCSP
jgi:hypothetical protein